MTNGHAQNTWDRGFLIGIITGGVIGAGLALYFAPRAAAELRKRMSGSARNLGDAYAQARRENAEVIVIAGSLFLVGEALDRLGFTHPTKAKTQRELVLQ